MDDVAVWDEALTEEQLASLFDGSETPLTLAGLGGDVLQAGDADMDCDFDQLDLVAVQVAAKYLTGEAATWGEGDWNGAPGGSVPRQIPPTGNGQFDQLDIIAALGGASICRGLTALTGGGCACDSGTIDTLAGCVGSDQYAGRLASTGVVTDVRLSSRIKWSVERRAVFGHARHGFRLSALYTTEQSHRYACCASTRQMRGAPRSPKSGKLCEVGHLAGSHELVEPDRQGHQPGYRGDSLGRPCGGSPVSSRFRPLACRRTWNFFFTVRVLTLPPPHTCRPPRRGT